MCNSHHLLNLPYSCSKFYSSFQNSNQKKATNPSISIPLPSWSNWCSRAINGLATLPRSQDSAAAAKGVTSMRISFMSPVKFALENSLFWCNYKVWGFHLKFTMLLKREIRKAYINNIKQSYTWMIGKSSTSCWLLWSGVDVDVVLQELSWSSPPLCNAAATQKRLELDVVVGIETSYLPVFKSALQIYEKNHMIRTWISSHLKAKKSSFNGSTPNKDLFQFLRSTMIHLQKFSSGS